MRYTAAIFSEPGAGSRCSFCGNCWPHGCISRSLSLQQRRLPICSISPIYFVAKWIFAEGQQKSCTIMCHLLHQRQIPQSRGDIYRIQTLLTIHYNYDMIDDWFYDRFFIESLFHNHCSENLDRLFFTICDVTVGWVWAIVDRMFTGWWSGKHMVRLRLSADFFHFSNMATISSGIYL